MPRLEAPPKPDPIAPSLAAAARSGEAVERRLVVGLGFRRAATAEDLAALVREALSRLPAGFEGLPVVLATILEKDRPPFREAAATLGLPALILPKSALAGTEDRITAASQAARACLGIPSVAEAAALAAAGAGARLVVTRLAVPTAVCAVASSASPIPEST